VHECMPGEGHLSRDEDLARVMVDYDVCIGCRACVSAYPFGAMSFNVIDKNINDPEFALKTVQSPTNLLG